MRLWGAGLLVTSCGLMGLVVAASFNQRVKNLRQLVTFVQLLESEIHFVQTTLPEILIKLAPQFSGPVQQFLNSLNRGLGEGSGDPFSQIWLESTQILARSGLPPPVLEELGGFGLVVGASDVREQEKHLHHLLQRLESAWEDAKGEREKQTKLWQYLGFCIGLLLVLLLI